MLTIEPVVTRSMFVAEPGCFIVQADLKGAEVAVAGWMSGDPLLIEHAARAILPETDPNWLDLHSDLAIRAFGLGCTMAEVKKKYKALRTAAKRTRFAHYYGASPDTIWRKALEDDHTITLDQIKKTVQAHDSTYPYLAAYFKSGRARVKSPGWICSPWGGYRRCTPARDRDLLAAQEREFQNALCQGGVADAITEMLGRLKFQIRTQKLKTRVVLSVHDSILVMAPYAEVGHVVDELLPLCMTKVPFNPVDFDGKFVNRGPYYFGIDVEVATRWGVPLEENVWREAGRTGNLPV